MDKTLLKDIKAVATKTKDGKLKRLNLIRPTLERIGSHLGGASDDAALMFATIFARQCEDNTSTLKDIANFLSVNVLDVMEFRTEITELVQRGYLVQENEDEYEDKSREYSVPETVYDAIVCGREISPVAYTATTFTHFDIFKMASNLIDECRHRGAVSKVYNKIEAIETEHTEIPLIQALKTDVEDVASRIFFYICCMEIEENTECDQYSNTKKIAHNVFDAPAKRASFLTSLIEATHPLLQKDWLDLIDPENITLSEKTIKAIYGKDASTIRPMTECTNTFDFVKKVDDTIDSIDQRAKGNKKILYRRIRKLEEDNKNLDIVRCAKDIFPYQEWVHDRMVIYQLTCATIYSSVLSLNRIRYFCLQSDANEIISKIKSGDYFLIKNKMANLQPGDMFSSACLEMTDEGKERIFGKEAELYTEKIDTKDIICSADIKSKKLYFADDLKRQLGSLSGSLKEEKYEELVSRLRDNNMPSGIAALLYGAPGTGKTESVMQMARETGRDVVHVDISSTKSCWLGESEKLIKGVFDKYRRLCKQSKVKPILLFNEADAILTKRQEDTSHGGSQTINAMQNIILEEMENLDGILIATTNLANNLDPAFERRFLFKIRFERPSVEAKAKIWTSKLPSLLPDEAKILAHEYNFSGGEIDNVARKVLLEEILSGEKPSFESINTLCREEKITSKIAKVGFA